MSIRERIYEIIEPQANEDDMASKAYDIMMLASIVLSLVPMAIRTTSPIIDIMELGTLMVFIADYILRWLTEDIRTGRRGIMTFVKYPFTINAIVDLISIMPSLLKYVSPSLKLFRLSRLLRILRVIRVIRYYEPLQLVVHVIQKEGRTLGAVFGVAATYIVLTALIMFSVDKENNPLGDSPHMFENFLDAIYWSACTLTTVGYGDIYPLSSVARIISMLSAIVGVAIIALPSGIITAGYMTAIQEKIRQKEENERMRQNRRVLRKHGESESADQATESRPENKTEVPA